MVDTAALLAGRRLFLFDLDGTLADTTPIHAAAFAAAFAPRGIMVDYPRIAGMATEAAVRRLLGDAADATAIAELVRAKRDAARAGLAQVREIAGARAFVAAAARRHRLALVTSGSRGTVALTLGALGLTDAFDPLITAEDVAAAKPSPAGFLRALATTGIPAADALVFEDSAAGLAAARAAGIDAIAIGPNAADWCDLTLALAGAAA